ncbi:MAG: tRNA (guanosine(46)-N7)-methyltransferase TrmB [Saprospiraceae bacterium]
MSSRNKLQKFAENLSFTNVFENFDPKTNILVGENGMEVDFSEGWNNFYFKNQNPLILELACGRGEYSLALAEHNPETNYIGVDIKGARIWKGANNALDKGLSNIAFLRTKIENIQSFFNKAEVDEIWITFPDPFLKKSKANRRLTSPLFLERYRRILKKDGIIHLKTDSDELYEYTMDVLKNQPDIEFLYVNDDIYASDLDFWELEIKTYYEKQHLANEKKIKYIRFRFDR